MRFTTDDAEPMTLFTGEGAAADLGGPAGAARFGAALGAALGLGFGFGAGFGDDCGAVENRSISCWSFFGVGFFGKVVSSQAYSAPNLVRR